MRLSLQRFSRFRPKKLSRFRPRIFTLIVFSVAAAVIALANLTFDESWFGDASVSAPTIRYRSYGWPMIWHRLVLHHSRGGLYSSVGWYYSTPPLIADFLLWLMLLIASSGTCEWLLRRYRPRLRWSLRTLLILVAIIAGLCAWYAKARNRAALEDEIIFPSVFVERWGPKWLDLLEMDRFRRRIVRADLGYINDERELLQLARLPDLRFLTFCADELTPSASMTLGGMRQLQTLDIELDRLTASLPAALSGLRQLRSLSIEQDKWDDDARLADECLAAIGQMTRLEALRLSNLPLRRESLAHLSNLKGLKSLQLDWAGDYGGDWDLPEYRKPDPEDCLRAISALTQLEWLSLQDSGGFQDLKVPNESLAYLAGLTELHTLSLGLATANRPMLSHLPPLRRLEALDLSGSWIWVDDDDLRCLRVLPRLKSLSLGNSEHPRRPPFTRAGLAELGPAESLEELRLDGDDSPEHVLALLAIKRLKRLHLGGAHASNGFEGNLTLDDGTRIHVYDVQGFQRALAALRKSQPGIIIDGHEIPIFRRMSRDGRPELDVDAALERASSWLPGGDLEWMTPKELADFQKEGGRASFYGATWLHWSGTRLVTAEF